MQTDARPPSGILGSRLLLWLVSGAFADLALLVVVVFAHAAVPDSGLLLPAGILAALLALLVVGSTILAIVRAWKAFPQHRRPIVFMVAITLAALLAHAYIIGSPAAATAATVQGQVGASFHDDRLNVGSTVNGQTMTLFVDVTGGDAVADIVPQVNGFALPGTGFSSPPTLSSPLLPDATAVGSWTLPASSSNANVSVAYEYLSCYSTSSHTYGCIMDEVFYVPEAMGVLQGQHCSIGGTDCHMEHPPLVPALMAAGMAVFGQYNAVGWRVAPALMGTFSIPIVFGIAWKMSGDKRLAYFAGTLVALDVMFFAQSGAGLLDVPETFFGLLALFVYAANVRFWKLDRYVVAGVMLGLAALAKETAIFMAAALATYVLLFNEGRRIGRVMNVLKLAFVVGLVFVAGLQAYDSTLATPGVPTFVQHVSYMLSYGSSLIADKLACQPTTGYWCKFANDPGGAPILPTDWLLYYSPIRYYATSVTVCPNSVNGVCQGGEYTYVALAYYGVTNLLETWTVFIWVPIVIWAFYLQRKGRGLGSEGTEPMPAESPAAGMAQGLKLAGLALVWFLWNYLPYIALSFYGRVTYPFYFIPAIPAVAMGAAYWMTREWFPKRLALAYLVAAFFFFFMYFPDKAFLPDWLRVLIGH